MNHYLPFDLQFFAEGTPENTPENTETKGEATEPDTSTGEEEKVAKSKKEDVNAQLQSALVDLAKLKRAQEKAASEAAEYKKKWKESLSEQEQASMEKAEAQAKRDEEFEAMKKTIAIHDLTENFMDLGYTKDLAKKAATAQVDGDTQAVLEYAKQFQEAQKKSWEADFLASRPDINIGGGSNGQTYTKEAFDKMSLMEKTKLKRENEAEYNRLLAL